MTAEGHLIFSISCAIFAKKGELTLAITAGDWWHVIPAALLTSLLPDIDHPKSVLGQRLSWIAVPIARTFGHRGFTHSLLAIIGSVLLFKLECPLDWSIPSDIVDAMIIGYLSHLLADMLTPAGVPLLWPCQYRFRLPLLQSYKSNELERAICLCLVALALYWHGGYIIPIKYYFKQIKTLDFLMSHNL